MGIITDRIKTTRPLHQILPNSWKNVLGIYDNLTFDSLDQFVYIVSKLTQNNDDMCGMSYASALQKLLKRESDFPKTEQESIRNLVRNNLFKRGLLTEEVYENFKYATDGVQVGVDVGKYAAGEPDCVITPSQQYIDFFYEMYVSISYSHFKSDSDIKKNVAKLLATVEELERQHIYIKINTVLPVRNPSTGKNNFFSMIPVFSHKDFKSVDVMSSIVNDRLLRKFYFAVMEEFYGNDLDSSYGTVMKLEKTINIGDNLNEVELFESIVNLVGK